MSNEGGRSQTECDGLPAQYSGTQLHDIKGLFWDEVDYIDEYERILKHRGYEINFDIRVKKTIPLV